MSGFVRSDHLGGDGKYSNVYYSERGPLTNYGAVNTLCNEVCKAYCPPSAPPSLPPPPSSPPEPPDSPPPPFPPYSPPACPLFVDEDMVSCKSTGDPHFRTFADQPFDFMGVGVFTLANISHVEGDCVIDVTVQAFQCKLNPTRVSSLLLASPRVPSTPWPFFPCVGFLAHKGAVSFGQVQRSPISWIARSLACVLCSLS